MPFDVREFPAGDALREQDRNRRLISLWLFALAFMIVVMVGLGGATRLTGSGLSIMEWAPIAGVLPPLSHGAWEKLFALYRAIPQYRLMHPDMHLAGFQHIFWLEYVHRLWGRLMGAVLIVPLAWFVWRRALSRALALRLLGLFVLGGLQGAIGWFMVASGFEKGAIAVSPWRLTLHLLFALALYAGVLWTALSVRRPRPRPGAPASLRRLVGACAVLLSITIAAGGLVAGTHAGFDYNTFPLMDGRLVPAAYGALHPFLRNLVANIAAVQFDHRLLATLTAALFVVTVGVGLAARPPRAVARALAVVGVLVLVQYALGVATLLSVVAIPLAVAHQVNAALLLGATLVTLHQLRAEPA
ncbi:MAG: COX15/CtaA family protein [Rhodospirillales bacterium]|nr:COX15/CtaA family protein [Rhodospirillales bacterium]